MPDLARWSEHLIEGDTWEFPAAERTCTLFTEPKAGEYSVRQIVKFGEFLLILAGDSTVELPTQNL